MGTTWLTVPTVGDRDTLVPMLLASGVPAANQVVVATQELPRNIQRWWNIGIRQAEKHGADVIIVVNDDVICHEPLTKLADHIRLTDCTLAFPRTNTGLRTGWCWALNLKHDVRPDEAFSWWFGDDDLWMRARASKGVRAVDLKVEHVARDYQQLREWQVPLVLADTKLFFQRYPNPARHE